MTSLVLQKQVHETHITIGVLPPSSAPSPLNDPRISINDGIPAPSDTQETVEIYPEAVIAAVLIVLMILLCGILAWLLMPHFFDFVRSKIPISKRRIQMRYDTIDAWLITKQVRAHGSWCDRARGVGTKITNDCYSSNDPLAPPTLDNKKTEKDNKAVDLERREPALHNTPIFTGNDEEEAVENIQETIYDGDEESQLGNNCMICFEEFYVGEDVSWSPHPECEHVFHTDCIREWLLRRTQCPVCRRRILPIDAYFAEESTHGRINHERLMEMATARTKRFMVTDFCDRDGLIVKKSKKSTRNRSACSASEAAEATNNHGPDSNQTLQNQPSTTPTAASTTSIAVKSLPLDDASIAAKKSGVGCCDKCGLSKKPKKTNNNGSDAAAVADPDKILPQEDSLVADIELGSVKHNSDNYEAKPVETD